MERLPHIMRKCNSILKNLLRKEVNESRFICDMNTISKRNSHILFDWMLKSYDPALPLSYCRSASGRRFIRQGSGSGTIKPFRTFYNGNTRCFEKIFFNDALELKSISDFYNNRSELACPHNIQSPALLQMIRGSKLTVVVYEFQSLLPLGKGSEYQALKAGTMSLAQNLPVIQPADPIRLNLIVEGEEYLLLKGIFTGDEISKVKRITESLPVCFQHLDLSTKNVFAGNLILDWDHSGYYHIGPDLGMLLFHYFYFHKMDFLSSFKEEIKGYHQNLGFEVELSHFTLSVLYYFTVYFKGYLRDYEDEFIFPEVVRECKGLLLRLASVIEEADCPTGETAGQRTLV